MAAVLGLIVGPGLVCGGIEQIPDNKSPIVEVPTTCDPRWYISVKSGAAIDTGATQINQGFTTDFTSTYFQSDLPSTAFIQSHDWSDAYGEAWNIEAEVGYVLTRHIELFGLFRFEHGEGDAGTNNTSTSGSHVVIGNSQTFPNVDFPISSKFGDYNSYGGEIGLRYFLLPTEAKFRPYVSLAGGAAYVPAIDIRTFADESSFFNQSSHALVYDGGFFEGSAVWTATGMVGIEYRPECHWSVGVEAGLRYISQLSENDRDFKGDATFFFNEVHVPISPFRRANDNSGDRLVVPLDAYIKFRF
jgi:hypothetical protein